MSDIDTYTTPMVNKDYKGQRIDKFLADCFAGMSRSRIQRLVNEGNVTCDDVIIGDNAHKVREGEIYQLLVPEATDAEPEPEDIPLDVVYEDSDLIVVNKPAGMTVHPAPGSPNHTLVNALLYHCRDLSGIGGVKRPGIVHRIDKDTSGIVVYARTQDAHRALSVQFQERQVEKVYHALVHGKPSWQTLHVDLKLLPDGDAQHRTVVNKRTGKYAITDFVLLCSCPSYSWLEARPLTGRTHQIRAHLAANGFSIVCDPLYGGNRHPVLLSEIKRSWRGDLFEERPLLSRLALHAYTLSLNHPVTGERITFTAPYPRDMDAVRNQLAKLYGCDPLSR